MKGTPKKVTGNGWEETAKTKELEKKKSLEKILLETIAVRNRISHESKIGLLHYHVDFIKKKAEEDIAKIKNPSAVPPYLTVSEINIPFDETLLKLDPKESVDSDLLRLNPGYVIRLINSITEYLKSKTPLKEQIDINLNALMQEYNTRITGKKSFYKSNDKYTIFKNLIVEYLLKLRTAQVEELKTFIRSCGPGIKQAIDNTSQDNSTLIKELQNGLKQIYEKYTNQRRVIFLSYINQSGGKSDDFILTETPYN